MLTCIYFAGVVTKLNRDTWANEAVAQTIKTNFIFWQVCTRDYSSSFLNYFVRPQSLETPSCLTDKFLSSDVHAGL